MKCPQCSREHDKDHPHFRKEPKLTDSGFPTHSRRYPMAHQKANQAEKKEFGENKFKELEKVDKKLGKHELIGKNTKNGKVEVSQKAPKRFDREIAFHERVENKILRRKK